MLVCDSMSETRTYLRLAAFATGLAGVFALAALAGARIDPSVDEGGADHAEEAGTMNAHGTTATAPGLAVEGSGYRLVPERTSLEAGLPARYAFRIVDASGETVPDFDLEHERRMHLIVVRRDLTGFQHLHPRQLEDGSWVAELELADGGAYRAYADFATGGESLTLATDLFAAGAFEPRTMPGPKSGADAGDGYRVTVDSPTAAAGAVSPVEFTVTRYGRELDSVEPYLGADGHLVALREHDLAFLHTHPEGEPGGPGPIRFEVRYPTPGRYRLFLQFKHGGEVRTAAFTQVAEHGDG
jgi:hypothetical protein